MFALLDDLRLSLECDDLGVPNNPTTTTNNPNQWMEKANSTTSCTSMRTKNNIHDKRISPLLVWPPDQQSFGVRAKTQKTAKDSESRRKTAKHVILIKKYSYTRSPNTPTNRNKYIWWPKVVAVDCVNETKLS